MKAKTKNSSKKYTFFSFTRAGIPAQSHINIRLSPRMFEKIKIILSLKTGSEMVLMWGKKNSQKCHVTVPFWEVNYFFETECCRPFWRELSFY
jgi:hypothetical protein